MGERVEEGSGAGGRVRMSERDSDDALRSGSGWSSAARKEEVSSLALEERDEEAV